MLRFLGVVGVRQFDAAASRVVIGLVKAVPGLLASRHTEHVKTPTTVGSTTPKPSHQVRRTAVEHPAKRGA